MPEMSKPFTDEERKRIKNNHGVAGGASDDCMICRYEATIAADRKRIEELGKYNEVLKGLRAEEAEDYEALQSRLERIEGALEFIASDMTYEQIDKYEAEHQVIPPVNKFNTAMRFQKIASQALKEKPKREE